MRMYRFLECVRQMENEVYELDYGLGFTWLIKEKLELNCGIRIGPLSCDMSII